LLNRFAPTLAECPLAAALVLAAFGPSCGGIGQTEPCPQSQQIDAKIAEPCMSPWNPELPQFDTYGEQEKSKTLNRVARGVSKAERHSGEEKYYEVFDGVINVCL